MIKDTAVQILLEHFSEGMVRTIVDAIAEEEREKCANIAEKRVLTEASDIEKIAHYTACKNIANEIRARGQE